MTCQCPFENTAYECFCLNDYNDLSKRSDYCKWTEDCSILKNMFDQTNMAFGPTITNILMYAGPKWL